MADAMLGTEKSYHLKAQYVTELHCRVGGECAIMRNLYSWAPIFFTILVEKKSMKAFIAPDFHFQHISPLL